MSFMVQKQRTLVYNTIKLNLNLLFFTLITLVTMVTPEPKLY